MISTMYQFLLENLASRLWWKKSQRRSVFQGWYWSYGSFWHLLARDLYPSFNLDHSGELMSWRELCPLISCDKCSSSWFHWLKHLQSKREELISEFSLRRSRWDAVNVSIAWHIYVCINSLHLFKQQSSCLIKLMCPTHPNSTAIKIKTFSFLWTQRGPSYSIYRSGIPTLVCYNNVLSHIRSSDSFPLQAHGNPNHLCLTQRFTLW